MASITNAVIVAADSQRDARYWVHERFTDSYGVTYDRFYMCDRDHDRNAQLAADAEQLLADLVAAEIAADVAAIEASGSQAVITTQYCTLSQVIVAARAAFPGATALIAVNLGDWFAARTFIELQTAFGFQNVSQYNAFKALWFTPNATLAASVRSAVGV